MILQHFYELFLGQVTMMDKVGISVSNDVTEHLGCSREKNSWLPHWRIFCQSTRAYSGYLLHTRCKPKSQCRIFHTLVRQPSQRKWILLQDAYQSVPHLVQWKNITWSSSVFGWGRSCVSLVNNDPTSDQKNQDNGRTCQTTMCFSCKVEGQYANQYTSQAKKKVKAWLSVSPASSHQSPPVSLLLPEIICYWFVLKS